MSWVFALNAVFGIPKSVSTEKKHYHLGRLWGQKWTNLKKNQKSTILLKILNFINANCIVVTQK